MKTKTDHEISRANGLMNISESKFSPVGGSFTERGPLEGTLRALRVDTHFSLTFKEAGIYALIKQLGQRQILFDLRRFRDEEEHRLYRMDETKWFRMVVNPLLVDETVVGSSVFVIVQGKV